MVGFVVLYLVGFVRTIFIIAIIYFVIRLVSRYLFPVLLDKGVKNMQQKMNNQQFNQQPPTRPEGEVTVEDKKSSYKSNQDKGDYVDFEEVE